MEEPVYLYFVGTAGSGKSTLVGAFGEWCRTNGIDSMSVNLDPGVEGLPYTPDVDIREWVSLSSVMEEYGLGPNGAQIAAADMLALHIREVKEAVEGYKVDYVLVDTPGQIEMFAFRKSSTLVVDALSPKRGMLIYLFDPAISARPEGFISSLLLYATVQSRFLIPSYAVISKSDLLEAEALEEMRRWGEDPLYLDRALSSSLGSMEGVVTAELLKALESLGICGRPSPVSSEEMYGMEDIYNTVQQMFKGGEDLKSD
ncbi:MAG: ATP/GTP-binding protein [Thermoplasmata archaeon]|nr:ATP/GTP-binding protein [Thermoplasmata archaeon]